MGDLAGVPAGWWSIGVAGWSPGCPPGWVVGWPMGWAAAGSLLWVQPRRRDELGYSVRADAHDPLGGMDLPVMDTAQHHQVVQVGGSAVGPLDDMVDFAPGRWSVTARVGASAVAGLHRPPQCGWDGAGGAADIEGLPGAVQDDRDDVASQHSRRSDSGVGVSPKSRQAAAGPVLQVLQVHDDRTCGRRPPTSGSTVFVPWSATNPHTSTSASAHRSADRRGSSAVRGADFASSTVRRVANRTGSSTRPVIFPPPPGSGVSVAR